MFLLQHYYDPSKKMMLFMVRTVVKEIRKKYKISILNRQNSANVITFSDETPYIDEVPQIQYWESLDKKRILCLPLAVVKDYCYFAEED